MDAKHLVVIDWGQLGQSLQRISDKHNLRWIIDQRCAVDVLDSFEIAREIGSDSIEVGQPGHKFEVDIDQIDGVAWSDAEIVVP